METGDIELEKRHGPVCSKFDDILKKHKITPQAYHSRSFNGNHCHKYVTKCVYKQLTACSVTTVHNCTTNVHIIEEAERIKRQFDMLNEAFAQVHAKISHGRPIGRDEYDGIHRVISNYVSMYRQMFPGKIFPKMHILEHHCLDWIKTTGFGMAAHGEQGDYFFHFFNFSALVIFFFTRRFLLQILVYH